MNKTDRARIVMHFKSVMRMWQDLHDRAHGDTWQFRGERASYHDCLESAKRVGLVTDYSLSPPRVWFPGQEEPVICKPNYVSSAAKYPNTIKGGLTIGDIDED